MSASLIPTPVMQFFDSNGDPLSGGKVYTYAAGTSTPLATYTDQGGATPNANPVILDSRGEAAIWFGDSSYKLILRTSADVLIWTADNVTAALASLAASSGSSLVGFLQAGTGAVARTVQAKAREVFSVKDFGATGDGTTDDTAAINLAITAANTAGGGRVIIPAGATYIVTANTVSGIATGVAGIVLKSNVTLQIDGTVKVKASAYGGGAYFGAIRCLDAGISNAAIVGCGTVDGNKANQTASTQCTNILLTAVVDNLSIRGIQVINANGNGVLCNGTSAVPMTDVNYQNLRVSNCAYIGLQASQFNGLVISGNRVSSTTDNGIDIYGENGTVTPTGYNFSITGNVVRSAASVGIFCETVKDGVVTGNTVSNSTTAGIAVNRINGAPSAIEVSGNTVIDGPIGIRVTGDMAGIEVFGNTFSQFTAAGVQLGDGVGNVSYVDVSNNMLIPASNTIAPVKITAVAASFITGKNNTVISSGIAASLMPYNIAVTSTGVNVDSFLVLPTQVGYAETLRYPLLKQADLLGGTSQNTAGPVDVATTNSTAGIIYVTARQGGTGSSFTEIPYVNYSGTLTLGTARTTFQTGNPVSGIAVSGVNARLTLGAANTYVNYFVQRTDISG